MSFWIIGTAHLMPAVGKARCICAEQVNDCCPFHGEVVRVDVQPYTPSGLDEFHPDTTHNPNPEASK